MAKRGRPKGSKNQTPTGEKRGRKPTPKNAVDFVQQAIDLLSAQIVEGQQQIKSVDDLKTQITAWQNQKAALEKTLPKLPV